VKQNDDRMQTASFFIPVSSKIFRIWIIKNTISRCKPADIPFMARKPVQDHFQNGRTPAHEEGGFKDPVFVNPGDEAAFRARFSQPGVFTCHDHMHEHEGNGLWVQLRASGTEQRSQHCVRWGFWKLRRRETIAMIGRKLEGAAKDGDGTRQLDSWVR
jgi:hypothetical protein